VTCSRALLACTTVVRWSRLDITRAVPDMRQDERPRSMNH
jgi:hypothetical protein